MKELENPFNYNNANKTDGGQIDCQVIKKNADGGKVYCGNCYECLKNEKEENGLPKVTTRMILCPTCRNKRCPKATDHNLECTNSNESGQPGSRY